jgi:hypothetical protein
LANLVTLALEPFMAHDKLLLLLTNETAIFFHLSRGIPDSRFFRPKLFPPENVLH